MPGLCGSELSTDWIFSFIGLMFLLATYIFPPLYRFKQGCVDALHSTNPQSRESHCTNPGCFGKQPGLVQWDSLSFTLCWRPIRTGLRYQSAQPSLAGDGQSLRHL